MRFRVPRAEFEKIFSRSSGPGGQNVNKLNSKVTIKLLPAQWQSASWIPQRARQQLVDQNFRYITKSGNILVQSERSRSQAANLDDCFEKLESAFEQALWVPKEPSIEDQERWVKIKSKEKKKMTQEKQFRRDKKTMRGKID